jgi:CHASE2 domain-containing sensor protein
LSTDPPKAKKKGKLKWLFRDALFCTILSLSAFLLLANLILSTSYFNPLLHSVKDFSFLDAYYSGNFSGKGKIDSSLVLVNIGDLNRQGIADLIETIHQRQPAVLGIDILFKGSEGAKADSALSKAIAKGNVVLPFIHSPDGAAILSDMTPLHAQMGYVNLTSIAPTEVIRGFVGVQDSKDDKVYAWASQVIRHYQKGHIWNKNQYSKKLLLQRRIKFYGHFDNFLNFSGKEILSGEVNPILKGKIVLVGYAGYPQGNPYEIEDKHFTPLNPHPLGKGVPDMFGIAIHANIINMLIQNDFFEELGFLGQGILIFLCSYLACLYLIWLDRKLKISYRTVRKLILFVFAVVFVGACLWLFGNNVVVEPTVVIIATIFSAGFVKYYKHLVRFIKTKRKFKSYLK